MSDQTQKATRRPGRPPKTGRAEVHAWVPEPLAELLKRDAAANSVSYGDRLAEILAAFYSGQGRGVMRQAS